MANFELEKRNAFHEGADAWNEWRHKLGTSDPELCDLNGYHHPPKEETSYAKMDLNFISIMDASLENYQLDGSDLALNNL